jgi:hypothetical protein
MADQTQTQFYKDIADKLALIPAINKTVNDNNDKLNEVNKSVDFLTAELEKTSKELDSVKKENMELKIAQSEMRKEISVLKKDLLYFETQSRRSNLLFSGFKEQENENCEEILKNFLNEKFGDYFEGGDDLEFERVHRLGAKSPDNKQRQIIAKFHKFKHRDLIWQHRFDLQQSPIWISETNFILSLWLQKGHLL